MVRARLDADGRLTGQDFALPDDPAPDPGAIRWAPGAMDGVLGSGSDATDEARAAAQALVRAARNPTERGLGALYDALRHDDALAYVDQMIEEVVAVGTDAGAVRDLGLWLAITACDRGPVKIGLTMLGITGIGDAGEIVKTLGAHDEFTLFAAVAISNGPSSPDQDLWQLAQVVDGWGRIQCVDRLRDTPDPQIKEWILREGFRNSIMYEYLAFVAATTGDLLGALGRPNVDRELLTSAGEIIAALISGGPAEDIGHLKEAPTLLDAYLDLLAHQGQTLTDLHAALSIARLLGDKSARGTRGWSESERALLLDKARRVRRLPLWPAVIAAGLESADPNTFWLANQAAPRFRIDTFDAHLTRLRADPLGGPWYHAWQVANPTAARCW